MIKKGRYYFIILVVLIISFCTFIFVKPHGKVEEISKISSGDSQVIAILDTGIHTVLLNENKRNIIATYNVTNNSNDVSDTIGHGTALASFLLGSSEFKLNGLLPDVKVIVIKITDENGKSSLKNLLKGLEIADKFNANIINISLGGDIENKEINNKINQLINKNITIVASSGDYGEKDILYPANIKNVISVASTDSHFNVSNFSNYDSTITCAFPGEDLSVVSLNNGKLEVTDKLYGTSFSTIYASAYIASIRDYSFKNKKNLTNNEIKNIMQNINPNKRKKIITNIDEIY